MAIFYIDVYNGKDRNTVTNAVASNPSGTTVLISFPTTGIEHDYITGMNVTLSSFSAWLNGTYTITVVDNYSFTLDGIVWQTTTDPTGKSEPAIGHEGGSTWETAWRSIYYGGAVGRIAPGDEIRISKTPDPVSIGNVYWSLSKNVILDSARTQTIFSGDAKWIVSPNVTSSRTTSASSFKYGSGCYSISTAAAFTTGKAVYFTLPSTLDLSAYQELSLFVKPNTTIVANNLRICLCSDTVGDVVVDEFKVPYNSGSNLRAWLLTKTGGGNLGSSIKSIAVYYDIDPGNLTIYLNNIIATKVNDINQSCLISKSSLATANRIEGNEWWPVGWIDGTTVAIDNNLDVTESNRRFTNFAEETVETFIRTPFIMPQILPYTNWGVTTTPGSVDGKISYKGGYEIGTENQNGLSFFASGNGADRGIHVKKDYIRIEGMCFSRFDSGVYISTSNYLDLDLGNCVGNRQYGIYMSNCYFININAYNMSCNSSSGVYIKSAAHIVSDHISGYHCPTNGQSGLYLLSGSSGNFKEVLCNGSNINLSVADSSELIMKYRQSTKGNYIGWGMYNENSVITFVDSLILSVQPFAYNSYNISFFAQNRLIDSIITNIFYARAIFANSCRATFDYGDSDYSPREGDTHYWQIYVGPNHNELAPFKFKIAEFAFVANKQVTIKAWVKRGDEQSDLALVLGESIAYGLTETKVYATTYGNAAWEQIIINFVPTEAGVSEVYFYFSVRNISLAYFSIGSIQITQPD